MICPLGDTRVHFALNCMAVSCPRLPRVAFDAGTLDEALDEAARRFFAESRNLQVDDAAQTVIFSEVIDFYPQDFLRHATSLQAYARRYHAGAGPNGYALRFHDYDWTVNHQL